MEEEFGADRIQAMKLPRPGPGMAEFASADGSTRRTVKADDHLA